MKYLIPLVLCFMALLGCSPSITPPSGVDPFEREFTVTGYCDCGQCCSWKHSWLKLGAPVDKVGANSGKLKDVGSTSSGTRTRYGVAAIDRKKYPMGTIFEIPGYGYARGEDIGGAIQGEHIDLWFPSHKAALKWGTRKLRLRVWVPKSKGAANASAKPAAATPAKATPAKAAPAKAAPAKPKGTKSKSSK